MSAHKLKAGYFVLEWLNIYAVAYYFNYLFFLMRQEFGFGSRENLLLAALNGFLYVPTSWLAGRFAQRRGYFKALFIGFGVMAAALAAGSRLHGVAIQITIVVIWTLGLCFTWPTLEAMVSEGETPSGLAKMLGIYNVIWASGAAVAYFTGGILFESLGRASLFWLPAGIHLAQIALAVFLQRLSQRHAPVAAMARTADSGPSEPPQTESLRSSLAGATTRDELAAFKRFPLNPRPIAKARQFLRMAWLANPFAYIAMNTVIPLIPELASRLELSTKLAGFVGSSWMFARLAAFLALWYWSGWQYRFGWLLSAYVAMVLSFAALLLLPNLAVVVAAQIIFGLAVGLIYYSSLFYSMDVGETKGEHGGMHEALIGIGLFAGPAIGAGFLALLPSVPRAGIGAVSVVLVGGLAALLWMRARK